MNKILEKLPYKTRQAIGWIGCLVLLFLFISSSISDHVTGKELNKMGYDRHKCNVRCIVPTSSWFQTAKIDTIIDTMFVFE